MNPDVSAPCQTSMNTGMAWSILTEIRTLLSRLAETGDSAAIDLRSLPLTTADRVRRFMLLKPAGQVNETEVARAMYITRRTLARRLEHEGTGYRQIREKLLAELAARHLADSRLTVESVAHMLGYNDAAAFRKAFRRWYRQSPGDFRAGMHD